VFNYTSACFILSAPAHVLGLQLKAQCDAKISCRREKSKLNPKTPIQQDSYTSHTMVMKRWYISNFLPVWDLAIQLSKHEMKIIFSKCTLLILLW